MTPAVVQGVSTDINAVGAPYSITMTGITAGNCLFYCVSGDLTNMATMSVTDNVNGAYTFIPASKETAHNTMQCHYLPTPTVSGGTIIATSNAAGYNGVIQYFLEISGYPGGILPDAANVGNGASGATPSISLTTLTNGCLVLGFARADGSMTVDAGWSTASNDSNGDVSEWKVQTTAGAITIPFGNDGSPWAISAVSLEANASDPTLSVSDSSATSESLTVVTTGLNTGNLLSTTNGRWSGSPTGFTYQWERCDAAGGSPSIIGGQTASTYRIVTADIGHTIRSIVTATYADGRTASVPSTQSVLVVA